MWYSAHNEQGLTIATHQTAHDLRADVKAMGRDLAKVTIEKRLDDGEGDVWEDDDVAGYGWAV